MKPALWVVEVRHISNSVWLPLHNEAFILKRSAKRRASYLHELLKYYEYRVSKYVRVEPKPKARRKK